MAGGLNLVLFEALNGLAGRSWALDTLIGLALDNLLVKAGPIGAAFLYAWYRSGDAAAMAKRRRILLATLLSLLAIAPLSKTLSEQVLAPRPFVLSQPGYALRDGALVEAPAARFNAMETGEMRRRVDSLRDGGVDANDLVTFPSDHAAFFVALALGILLASRGAGALALGWALVVTLGSRVAAGMHWPLDIAAGGALGAAILALVQLAIAGRRGRWLDPLLAAAERRPGLAAAFLFLALLEAANAMQTAKAGLEIASAVAGRLL